MTNRLALALLVGVGLLATGCMAWRLELAEGAPDSSLEPLRRLQEFRDLYGPAETLAAFKDSPSVETRNAFIEARLIDIDIEHAEFVRRASQQRKCVDSLGEMLELGLSLAITMVDSAGSKTNLAALLAGVTGTKETLTKNYFREQTMPALVSAMEAERKRVRLRILQRQLLSLSEYGMQEAMRDLAAYERAGSFDGALDAIQEDAGVKAREYETKLQVLGPATEEGLRAIGSVSLRIAALERKRLDKTLTDDEIAKFARIMDKFHDGEAVKTFDEAVDAYRSVGPRMATEDALKKEVLKAFEDAGLPPVTRPMLVAAVGKAPLKKLQDALKALGEDAPDDEAQAREKLLGRLADAKTERSFAYVGQKVIVDGGIIP